MQRFLQGNTMNPTTAHALNSVDYFVIFIFAISILAGYLRGFMKEVISVVTLIAATVVSTMFSGKLAATFSGTANDAAQSAMNSSGMGSEGAISMVSIGVSYVALFLATMLVGYIVSTLITGLTGGVGASLTNRFLGAAFGAVRGFIIVIILMFIAELTPMVEQPAWGASEFVKSFQPMVSWIEKMVHPGLEKIIDQAQSAIQGVGGGMDNVRGVFGGATGGDK
jgi:membrane protein required for colicin V production